MKYDPIGSGPLGTVFKGKHNALGLDICVKELKDIFGYFSFLQRGEVIKRLKKELCAQAQVRHPAWCRCSTRTPTSPRPYFVMELLQGLAAREARRRRAARACRCRRRSATSCSSATRCAPRTQRG